MTPLDPEKRVVTEEMLDLKLKALVSQMTTRIVVGMALSAGISQTALPTAVTIPAVAVALVGVTVKSVLAVFGGR